MIAAVGNLKGQRWLPFVFAVAVAATAAAQPLPELATARTDKPVVEARRAMVVAAHPLAAEAGLLTLKRGGSAVDAAIASALVLNLVEPQSSGIGGGGFLLAYHAATRSVHGYDGRETAPAAAAPDLFVGDDGQPVRFLDALRSGRAIGAPGLVRMMALAHQDRGRLPWAALFEPAIRIARDGFPVGPRLAFLIARDPLLREDTAARRLFFDAAGQPLVAGATLRNPELADLLEALATRGPEAFYAGTLPGEIAAVARSSGDPKVRLVASDITQYRALRREPLCAPYKVWRICGMPPPTAGGITVLQILKLLEDRPYGTTPPGGLMAAHLFAEASRLAYADRDRYIADPAYVSVPAHAMLAAPYLRDRASRIDPRQSMGRALPGRLMPGSSRAAMSLEVVSTTHLSVVDPAGNIASLTATIESAFGSRKIVRGFLLNNQLTDFSFAPDRDGEAVANRVEGGKRPRSAMSPTIVLDAKGRPVIALGSPGGPWILGYVARGLLGVLEHGLTLQQAVSLPHVGNRNGATELERGTAAESLREGLQLLGHEVRIMDAASGLHGFERTERGWRSGVDPRREGAALGLD